MTSFTIYENKKATQASESEQGKQWVTFVHGAGGSSSIWFKQIRDFQKHYNVLLLDLRGHGDSKPTLKTAFKQKYTFSALANDILEVLDHLKIEKSHFIGISLGTILIRQLAEMYPERVQTMVLGGAIFKNEFSFANINEIRKRIQVCFTLFSSISLFCFCDYAQKKS